MDYVNLMCNAKSTGVVTSCVVSSEPSEPKIFKLDAIETDEYIRIEKEEWNRFLKFFKIGRE